MKQNKFYLLAAATALLLSACNNEEVPGTQESDLARFTGSIEGVKTRAYDTTWENGDQIGITGTSGWETYTNITYNWNASGYFTADQKDIYYNTPEDVAFSAYYPWKTELSSSTSYDFNTDAQSQQKTFDFLYATGTGSKYEPEVEFNFTHCMSKLSFIVKAGADVTLDEVKAAKYSLRSFLNNGTFDRVTGKVNAAGSVLTAPWAFANSSIEADNAPSNVSTERNSVTYNLILDCPRSSSAAVINSEIDSVNHINAIHRSNCAIKSFQSVRERFRQAFPHQFLDIGIAHVVVCTLTLPCAYAEVEVVLISRTTIIVVIVAVAGYIFRVIFFHPICNGLIEGRHFSIAFFYRQVNHCTWVIVPFTARQNELICQNFDSSRSPLSVCFCISSAAYACHLV